VGVSVVPVNNPEVTKKDLGEGKKDWCQTEKQERWGIQKGKDRGTIALCIEGEVKNARNLGRVVVGKFPMMAKE